jgi:hypothetical protein
MEKLSNLCVAVFTTNFLTRIACFLASILLLKGLGHYYDFSWINALASQ